MRRKDLAKLTKAALVAMAKERRIARYSRMTKEELVRALSPEPARPTKRRRGRAAPRRAAAAGVEEPAPGAAAGTRRKKRAKPPPKQKIYLAGRARKKTPPQPRGPGAEPPTPRTDAPEAAPRGHPEPAEQAVEASKYEPADRVLAAPGEDLSPLPAHYDEDRLGLLARDPRWLFAFWDVSRATRRATAGAGLVLRLFDVTGVSTAAPGGDPILVLDVGEADNWFVEVGRPARSFVAEIGWVDDAGRFRRIATSRPATTAADSIRTGAPVRFVRIPFDVPLSRLREWLLAAGRRGKSLAEALHELGYGGDVPAGMGIEEFLRLHAAAQAYAPGVSSLESLGLPPSRPRT